MSHEVQLFLRVCSFLVDSGMLGVGGGFQWGFFSSIPAEHPPSPPLKVVI